MSYCDSDVSVILCTSFIVRRQLFGCVHSRGHIFSPIIMKLGRNVCLNKISNECENGLCQVKNKVTSSNLSKNLMYTLDGHIFSLIIMKLGRNVCLDEISDKFENWSCWVKTRSLVQILEKTCVCSRSHISSSIIMKLGQNVCLDKISDIFENG